MPPKTKEGPASRLVAIIHEARRVALRAGSKPHKPTSMWAVVVDEVFQVGKEVYRFHETSSSVSTTAQPSFK